MKLFPTLERISIKEHAKSHNYEDYIGVVLDKRNNIFKVVEGKFTDKKDMYRKMKKRGLILRKAYEKRVWEWIEANADGVIISYLMLSTAFSKWRSNNVLHKYYEKLLHDIPELNREREKGNPNTRGGDFITTDSKPAPKRQEESVELEEENEDYGRETHTVQLVGVPYNEKLKEHPIVSNSTDENGKFILSSPFWLNTNGELKNPAIIDIVDDLMNTDNSSTITGVKTKNKYKEIKVYIDGKLQKVYDPASIGTDVREKGLGKISYERSAASHIVRNANEKIRELYNKLEAGNLTAKEEKDIKDQISFLRMQKQQTDAEKHIDINNLRHTWQAKVAHDLGHDSDEIRKSFQNRFEDVDNDDPFKKLMISLASVGDQKEDFDSYISNAIETDENFSKLNRSFGLIDFEPLSTEQIRNIYNKMKEGKVVSEDKQERKSLLHNLIWYVLADGRMLKQSQYEGDRERLGINKADKLSSLIQTLQTTGTGGFNNKTQSGKANADIQVGDLNNIRKQIDRLSKEPIYTEPHDREKSTFSNRNDFAELKMKGLSKRINSIEKQLQNKSLSGKEKSKLISDRNELEKEYKDLTNKYIEKNPVDNSKVYSTDGKILRLLDPKDTVDNSSYTSDKYEIPQKEAVNITQYDNDGAYQLSNSIPYQGSGFGYSAGPIKMTGQIVEDTTQTQLNPKLFENDVLIPEVRDALYKIAMVFKDYLDLPFEIKDVYFTGSNANYNYTNDSDIDLHLVYDFEQAGANAELLSKYLVVAKKDFNDKYDIKVKGMPVELGCENIAEPLVSTGVYSLGANTWVIKPENAGIEIPDVDMNAFDDLSTQIDDTIRNQNASAIENLWKKIRELRKDSLAKEGEFGMGNMLFKKLRNSNYLEKLRNSMYDAQSRDLSLESSKNLDEAELNDKKEYSEYLKDLEDELKSDETQDLLADMSLISYLDGYKDRNEKREVKEEKDGILNEGNIPNWKLNRALKYIDNEIPAEISKYKFVDSDGISLCRFVYDPKKDIIKKIPVRREEVVNGVYQFISKPDEAQDINFEDFYKIVNSDENQSILWKTSLYDDLEQMAQEVEKYKNTKASDFKQWYDDHNEILDLDDLLKGDKKLRNKILWQMYKDNTTGAVNISNLRKKYNKYYSSDEQEVEEGVGDKLTVAKDMNDINAIFTALGLDPRYVTRPIYEHIKKRNNKTFGWDDIERQWEIISMDDVRRYLKDGKFDTKKMPYKDIHVYMKDVNSADSRPQPFNLVELNNLIKSSEEENDINNNSPKIAYDIYRQLPNASNKFRQQTRQTYTERMLTPDQVKKALEYVQSKDFIASIKSDIEELNEKISQLNPEKEDDDELLNMYQRELNRKQRILDFSYAGNGNLVDLYDSMKSMKQNGFNVILAALNAVEEDVTVIPRYSVKDNHGFAFYIKLPTEGFTYEDIKSHGSYDVKDMMNTIKKYNGSY